MRPTRPLVFIIILTVLALFYVDLQVQQIKLGYQIKKKEEVHARLLDQNRILRYNTLALRSPGKMEKSLLARKINMEMPQQTKLLVYRNKQAGNAVVLAQAIRKSTNFILGFFTIKHEAYAKTDK